MKIYITKWDHVTLHTKIKTKNNFKKPVKSVASLELEC
jgi:hypothetical protein